MHKTVETARKEDEKVKSHTVTKLTRKQIYDEVWSISISGMVKKYDIAYSLLWKQVKDANIPIPPAGYWTKKEYGKETVVAELTGDSDEIVELYKHIRSSSKREEPADAQIRQKNALINTAKDKSSTECKVTESLGEAETQERWGQKYNVYRREILYKEVWQFPVTEVAKKYSVSDVAIHKICKSLDVPTPPPGYWAKVRAGKKVDVPPLPKSDKQEIKTGVRSDNRYDEGYADELYFLSPDEKERLFVAASEIVLTDENEKMHPKIAAHRKRIENWEKAFKKQNPYQQKQSRKTAPYLKYAVADDSLPRVFRIIDTLIKTMKPLGVDLDDDLCFHYESDRIQLSFSEATTEIPHELTKEERMSLLKYEDERKRYSWASKPQIRKYDHIHNGRISVGVGLKRRFRDGKSIILEEQLGDMMIAIFIAINAAKIAREEREEAERKRQEEQRRREELRKRYNEEVEHTLALENQAEDYAMACKIRALISAVESKGNDDGEIAQWIKWAKAKADWYDPTIAAEDEFFGERNHAESAERKRPKERYYW